MENRNETEDAKLAHDAMIEDLENVKATDTGPNPDYEPPTIPMTSADPTARVKMPVLIAVIGSKSLVLGTLLTQADAVVEKYAEDPRVRVVVEGIESVAAMVEHFPVGDREAVEVRFALDIDKGQSTTSIQTRDANLHPSFDSLEEYEAFESSQREG